MIWSGERRDAPTPAAISLYRAPDRGPPAARCARSVHGQCHNEVQTHDPAVVDVCGIEFLACITASPSVINVVGVQGNTPCTRRAKTSYVNAST